MISKARVEYDMVMNGVRLAVRREYPGAVSMLHWGEVQAVPVDMNSASAVPPDDVWLRLQEDDARAVYEGLAEYFGHAGHDIRTLRKDYEAERVRVDKFIAHVLAAS